MKNINELKELAPFTASDLQQTVKELRKYRSLMWNKAQEDGRLDYAIQYYEVIRSIIFGIYFVWEKYKYENGWIDSIAEEGEDLMEYRMFQIGIIERIEGLLNAIRVEDILGMFRGGQDTRDKIILIFSDLLSNMKDGTIKLDKYNFQSL